MKQRSLVTLFILGALLSSTALVSAGEPRLSDTVTRSGYANVGSLGQGGGETPVPWDDTTQPPSLAAAKLPEGFTDTEVVHGLPFVTGMEFAPDGRLFISTQGGDLLVVKNGALLPTPFVHVIVDTNGERALTGVAFDPDFATNHYIYVYYAPPMPAPHFRVSRFTADGDVAVPGSELILYETDPIGTGLMHNGGTIHFGKDGKLYIAIGDANRARNAQMLTNQFGKILRINPDGSIPTDNPFYTTAEGKNRAIWAYGLRNPFTFAVQPNTGRIFINDVGEKAWEEINDGIAGANYGWSLSEGPTSDPRFVSPIFAYGHGTGDTLGCAITGGAFYNPPTPQFPSTYIGNYFFQDLCNGWIHVLDLAHGNTVTSFATNVSRPVDLEVGPEGALYYLTRSRDNGSVHKIQFSAAPAIDLQPVDQIVSVGFPATFSVHANGAEPLTYQWQRDGANIPGATSFNYTIPSVAMADNGATFRCVVSIPHGTITSASAKLTVTTERPPSASILTPAEGELYSAGNTITFSGTGSDSDGTALLASALTWEVVFHHDDHAHPFMLPRTGIVSGTFIIPQIGEKSTNVWYRIYLTVQNSSGLTYSTYRDIQPRTSTITIQTRPAGLPLMLDDQPITTPNTTPSVVGMLRTLEAPQSQTVNEVTFPFISWSDGGQRRHRIETARGNRTYTAVYSTPVRQRLPLIVKP